MTRPFVPTIGMSDMPVPAIDDIDVTYRDPDTVEIVFGIREARQRAMQIALLFEVRENTLVCCRAAHLYLANFKCETVLPASKVPGLVMDLGATIAARCLQGKVSL
jgi:hypothetical protein